MKFVIADSTLFLDSLKAINTLVNEGTFKADDKGLSLTAMDPANVSLVAFKMGVSEFMEWSVPEPSTFSVKIAELKSIISRAPKASLTLSVENNKLNIILMDKGKKKEFSVGILSEDAPSKDEPPLQFASIVSVDCAELKDAIADATLISESCEFNVKNGKMFIKANAEGKTSTSDVVATVTGTDSQSKYSIEYLDKILSTKLSKNAKVQFKTDYPVKISFVNDKGTVGIIFILAPRISND